MPAARGDPFAALGDARRRQIVDLLSGREHSVQELADELPISRPAVSRHLRLLKEAGLVDDRAQGVKRLYRLAGQGAEEIRDYMDEVWGHALARFKIAVENTESP